MNTKKVYVPKEFSDAKWIWYTHHTLDIYNIWMQARKVITLKTLPKKSEICITADYKYKLYVNGKYVCEGPARGYYDSWPFDRVDVAPYLKKGKNVIGVLVHQMGIHTYTYHHAGAAGLLIGGKIGKISIDTNTDWMVREAPGFNKKTPKVAAQMGFQEHADARVFDDGWLKEKYSEPKNGWFPAPNARNAGMTPWNSFEEREIPLLRSEIVSPEKFISSATAKQDKEYLTKNNIVNIFAGENYKWIKSKEKNPCKIETGKNIATTAKAFLIDFGKELTGTPIIKASGASGGEVLDIMVCELLDGIKPILPENIPMRQPNAFGNRVILKKGTTNHEFFSLWGFRYLVAVVRGAKKDLTLEIKCRNTAYALEKKSLFESSDEMLNKIYDISVHTQQCCMLDAYVDCPWREQTQWWGDTRVQAKNTFTISADSRLLKRGIRHLGMRLTPDGLTHGFGPAGPIAHTLPDFSLTWLITHWDYYWQTGDTELFKKMLPQIKSVLGYFENNCKEKGLITYDKKYWLFIDWCDIVKDSISSVYNLMYLKALRKIAEVSKAAKENKLSKECSQKAAALEKQIIKKFYDSKKHIICQGYDEKGKLVKKASTHATALALILNIIPEEHDNFIQSTLLPMIKGKPVYNVTPSPFFMYYIFEALKRKGYKEEVVDCTKRWWGDFVDNGFSTTPENWGWNDPVRAWGRQSMCHAWSAHPVFHLSEITLGIVQTKPAWKEIKFSPLAVKGQKAGGSVATPYGLIKCEWDWTGEKLKTKISAPKQITVK